MIGKRGVISAIENDSQTEKTAKKHKKIFFKKVLTFVGKGVIIIERWEINQAKQNADVAELAYAHDSGSCEH